MLQAWSERTVFFAHTHGRKKGQLRQLCAPLFTCNSQMLWGSKRGEKLLARGLQPPVCPNKQVAAAKARCMRALAAKRRADAAASPSPNKPQSATPHRARRSASATTAQIKRYVAGAAGLPLAETKTCYPRRSPAHNKGGLHQLALHSPGSTPRRPGNAAMGAALVSKSAVKIALTRQCSAPAAQAPTNTERNSPKHSRHGHFRGAAPRPSSTLPSRRRACRCVACQVPRAGAPLQNRSHALSPSCPSSCHRRSRAAAQRCRQSAPPCRPGRRRRPWARWR